MAAGHLDEQPPASLPGWQRIGQEPDADAERIVAECHAKLATYRAALESGTNPELINGWIDDVLAERARAKARLIANTARSQARLSKDQIRAIVDSLTDLATVISRARPEDKAELYKQLGLRLTYHPRQVSRIR